MLAVRDANRIVVETVGIGYEVLIPLSTYYRLPPSGERLKVSKAKGHCSRKLSEPIRR
jgi:Holliday junction resolvasome RuvABC DNA-binding subunit